jgi:hypothetical protein
MAGWHWVSDLLPNKLEGASITGGGQYQLIWPLLKLGHHRATVYPTKGEPELDTLVFSGKGMGKPQNGVTTFFRCLCHLPVHGSGDFSGLTTTD